MTEPARERLRLSLESAGRPGLIELLLPAIGRTIDDARFEIIDLLAAGRQSFVFRAIDRSTDRSVVVKQPAFDYRRPIAYARSDVARARAALQREHAVLVASSSLYLPTPVALLRDRSIVPCAALSAVFGGPELFLIEEHVRGTTLAERRIERESEAARIAREFVAFFRELLQRGWFYADVSAGNLMIGDGGDLRVVDAGSAAAIRAGRVAARGFTPAFTTPRLYAALEREREIAADLSSVLPILAKVLHFALTGREPFNGALPDVAALTAIGCSDRCTAAFRAMLDLDADPTRIRDAEDALSRFFTG